MEPQNPGANTNPNPSPNPSPLPPPPAPTPTPEPVVPTPMPNPTPAVPPESVVQPLQPQFPPAQEPQPMQPAAPEAPQTYQAVPPTSSPANKPRKFIIAGVGAIVAALIILGIGAYFLLKMMSGAKLEAYTNNDFSMQVPVGYTVKDEDGRITFTEKTEDDEKTASIVYAMHSAYPTEATDEQLDEGIKQFKEEMEKGPSGITGDEEVTNIKVTDATYNGNKAVKVTADGDEDGEKSKVTMIAVFSKNDLYLVAVKVHSSDPGLSKKVNTILESFKVKE